MELRPMHSRSSAGRIMDGAAVYQSIPKYTPAMSRYPLLVKPQPLVNDMPGVLVDLTPASAGWEYIHFTVRRLVAGQPWSAATDGEECCLVLLRGACTVRWRDNAPISLGPRADVFAGYPHAVYLPHGHEF